MALPQRGRGDRKAVGEGSATDPIRRVFAAGEGFAPDQILFAVGEGRKAVQTRRLSKPSHQVILALLLWGGLWFAAPLMLRAANAGKPTLESLGNEVQCSCGCVAPLNQCPHLDCAQKAEMQAFVKKEIADGKSETAILQDLSLRYGVQVLTAPPAKGFDLAVWILPGVGLLVGLGIVVVIVRRWKRKPAAPAAPAGTSLDPKILTAMEEEMKSTGLR